MEIKKLIKVYNTLLKYYKIQKRGFLIGLCGNASTRCNTSELYHLFSNTGYYRYYINKSTCALKGPSMNTREGTDFRIKFMESEIVHLKTLLSEGYTDV